MPQNSIPHTLDALDWPALLDALVTRCASPYGANAWHQQAFCLDITAAQTHLAQVAALQAMLVRLGAPILPKVLPPDSDAMTPHQVAMAVDVTEDLQRLAKGGQVSANRLAAVLRTMAFGQGLFEYVIKGSHELRSEALTQATHLWQTQWTDTGASVVEAVTTLAALVSPEGDVLDSASQTLAQLRHRLASQQKAVQQQLANLMQQPDVRLALQDALVTQRDGRYVLPVRAGHQNALPGLIHGGSSSGATVFIEPKTVFDLNNRIAGTINEIDAEIDRLVAVACQTLAPIAPGLMVFLKHLAQLDRRLGAAKLSRDLDATVPTLVAHHRNGLQLAQARHPLLMLQQLDRPGGRIQAIVANDVQLGLNDERTMIISGPNTGGKTVLLKTVGLLALMVQAGVPIPAKESSRVPWFDTVWIDVGDPQSLTQNLSTFSGHLMAIRPLMQPEADLNNTLVLIDEIAAGTDPAEGVALARAVLATLHGQGAMTLVTTHLGELKVEAHHHPGYTNASVLFDIDTLSPTFRLIQGTPGTSHALAIARRLGIPDSVVDLANQCLSAPVRESASLIEALEAKQRKLDDMLTETESFRREAKEIYEDLEYQRQQLVAEKRQTLQTYRASLKGQLHDMEAMAKRIKKDFNRKAHPARTDSILWRLKRLDRNSTEVFGSVEGQIEAEEPLRFNTVQALTIGQTVHSKRLNMAVEVIKLNANQQTVGVQSGVMKATLPLDDLLPLHPRTIAQHQAAQAKAQKQSVKRPERSGTFTASKGAVGLECKVLGMRVDDALVVVEEYLDRAALQGFERIAIIHGQGTGALKKAIRDWLRRSPLVANFGPSEAHLGGDGRTEVLLR
jgi:DNA mismatch repair protein MutS2